MASPIDTLDYTALLQLPDDQALLGALSQARSLYFPALMEKYGVTFSPPTPIAGGALTATEVDLISVDPRQTEGAGALRYHRLDLANYMECCERYLLAADAASTDTVAAWFMTKHSVHFTAQQLSLSALTADPDYVDRQLLTVSVLDDNYVWCGNVVLWVVAPTHLGLWAKPGISTGIRWEDVGLSPTP